MANAIEQRPTNTAIDTRAVKTLIRMGDAELAGLLAKCNATAGRIRLQNKEVK